MVSLVAALLAGVFTWISAKRLTGGDTSLAGPQTERSTLGRHKNGQRSHRDNFQVWLSQAGAAVTPGQFWAVSVGVGVIAFVLLLAISGTFVVSALPAAAVAATPYAYWSGQRRKQAAARSAAWPDALRYLVGVLGAGVATLHDALVELARSGPEPLRPPISRYVRMSARVGDRQALEAVRADLADPISDPVLLAFEGAVEEGTDTVLRVLADLSAQITSDLQLAEKIRTLQTQITRRYVGLFCVALPRPAFPLRHKRRLQGVLRLAFRPVCRPDRSSVVARWPLGLPAAATSYRHHGEGVREQVVDELSVEAALAAMFAGGAAWWVAWRTAHARRSPAARMSLYLEGPRVHLGGRPSQPNGAPVGAEVLRRVLGPLAGGVISFLSRMLLTGTDDALELSLRQAALNMTPASYRRQYLRWLTLTPLVLGAVGAFAGSASYVTAFFLAGVFAGARRMPERVKAATKRRSDRIRSDLPTVVSVLALKIENNKSLVVAVSDVVTQGSGP